jgi:hypothetical protein
VSAPAVELDPGLLARMRAAGEAIQWRPVPSAARHPSGRDARIATLHEEEARVETWGAAEHGGICVDSGPVGALALVLEAASRGMPSALGAANAGRDPAFPQGALVATWGSERPPDDSRPRWKDIVDLARYALV